MPCSLLCSLLAVAGFALAQRSVLLEMSAPATNLNPATHRESKVTYQVAVATVSEWTEDMVVCIWTEFLAVAAIASASHAGFTRSANSYSVQPSGIYVVDSTKHGIYQIKAAVVLRQTAGSSDPALLSDVAALQFQVHCSKVQVSQFPVGSELLPMSEEASVCDGEQSSGRTSSWTRGVAASTAAAQAQVRHAGRLSTNSRDYVTDVVFLVFPILRWEIKLLATMLNGLL
jgi:hypothetical protein